MKKEIEVISYGQPIFEGIEILKRYDEKAYVI